MQTVPHVYVDADACPVKPEAVQVAERHGLPVTFVANASLQLPRAPRARFRFLEALELAVREARRQRAGSVAASVTPPAMAP